MALGFPRRWTGRLTVDLPVIALSLAALAHWIRGAHADALIFLAVTLLLVLTELRGTGEGTMPDQPYPMPGVTIAAVGVLVLAFGRDSLPVGVAISVVGLFALFSELREPSLPADRPVP